MPRAAVPWLDRGAMDEYKEHLRPPTVRREASDPGDGAMSATVGVPAPITTRDAILAWLGTPGLRDRAPSGRRER
jgi:hypothetical protein